MAHDPDEPWIVPMSSPDIGPAEVEAVRRVLASSQLSQGPFLEEFERRLGDFLGLSAATAVSSGTAGLHLALRAAGAGEGDLVFTPSFSFVATANAVLYLGARPVFVDIDPETGNLSPDRLEERMEEEAKRTSPRRFRAILPVHVFGQPADMPAINRIAEKWGTAVIEDACEALGSEHLGRKVGTFGDAAVFGFFPNKQVTAGEGGAIVTRRSDWADRFRCWRNQGRSDKGRGAAHVELGYNYRLDELSAALGAAQMERIEELLAKREAVARLYNDALREVEAIRLPLVAPATTRMSWFVYTIRARSGVERDFIREFLAERGVPTRVYFAPIHLQPSYGGAESDIRDLQQTVRWGELSLSLPFSGVMSEDQVLRVAECLKRAVSALDG